jgi:hypothetical protein
VVDKLNKMGLNTQVFFLDPEEALDVSVVFRSEKVQIPIADQGEAFPMLKYYRRKIPIELAAHRLTPTNRV